MAVSERKPNAVCAICGRAYWRQPNRLSRSRFCSNVCKAAGRVDGNGLDKSELARLYYDEHLSMQEIADRLGCSANKIVYWMEQYGFERRSWSEATYVQRNPDGDPFKIKMPETPEEWTLFGLGLGIFMGEGAKTGPRVSLANTNPDIHRLFLVFLQDICGVDRSQLKAWLNVYDDRDVRVATEWWCEELGLKTDQFFAPTVRASRGGNYANKSKYGTLSIIFSNTKLKKSIDGWCSEYYGRFQVTK